MLILCEHQWQVECGMLTVSSIHIWCECLPSVSAQMLTSWVVLRCISWRGIAECSEYCFYQVCKYTHWKHAVRDARHVLRANTLQALEMLLAQTVCKTLQARSGMPSALSVQRIHTTPKQGARSWLEMKGVLIAPKGNTLRDQEHMNATTV